MEQSSNKTSGMREVIENFFDAELCNAAHATRMTAQMSPELIDCSDSDMTLTLAFAVYEHELNPVGTMMGGVMATAFDTTCGTLILGLANGQVAPTMSMTINYIRPVKLGDRFIVTAKVQSFGKRAVHVTAEGICESTGAVAATASSVFMSPALL